MTASCPENLFYDEIKNYDTLLKCRKFLNKIFVTNSNEIIFLKQYFQMSQK